MGQDLKGKFDHLVKQLGLNIRTCREAKGWSQQKLSFEADVDRSWISNIESGKRNPSLKILLCIATALDRELVNLLQEKETQNQESATQ